MIGRNGLDDNRLDENRLDQNELDEKWFYRRHNSPLLIYEEIIYFQCEYLYE